MVEPSPPPRPSWSPWLTLLLVALLAGFAGLRSRPPPPAPVDAPPVGFSATRAGQVLDELLGDGSPHGVGTPGNAAVRERIVQQLQRLGLEAELQSTFVCRGFVCAPVVNVIAEVPGSHQGGPAVLLVSHYDSVHAGPGAGDDTHGVALSLEIARALLAGPPPLHPVRLLFDEGEEVGLLGAQAFATQHPRAHEVSVVVNAEARGTSGPSSMFEATPGNAALVHAYLDHAPRPQATSLAIEVYRRMPNDTDLTVFRTQGFAGLNFAFVGGVGHYHTPLDDRAHLDLGSVQHQGDNVLATVRALAFGALPLPAEEDEIYADLLGLEVIAWPARHALTVPAVMLVLLLGMTGLAWHRGRVSTLGPLWGVVAVLGVLVLTIATALGVAWLVGAVHGERIPAHAQPLPLRLLLWIVAMCIALSLGQRLARRASALSLAFGIWITWAGMALWLASAAPGASVALCIPVAVAVVGLAWALAVPRHESRALPSAAVGMIALWSAMALALEDVFGFALTAAVAFPIAVVLTTVVPSMAPTSRGGPWLRRALGAAALVTLGWACLAPVYDADAPRRLALVHYDDRSDGEAHVAAIGADAISPALAEAMGTDTLGPALPWSAREGYRTTGEPGEDPPPTLAVEDSRLTTGGRSITARLASARGADRAVVLLPSARLEGVWVEGLPVSTSVDRLGRLLVFGLPAQGVRLELQATDTDPLEATVVDCVGGLPQSAGAIAAARDTDGVPIQWGDLGCVGIRVKL